MDQVLKLKSENDKLRDALLLEQQKNVLLDNKVLLLQEQLKHLLHKRFSPSSEKVSPNQKALFDETEEIESEAETAPTEKDEVEVQAHTRQRKPRVSIPADLPREDIIHDLPESEKVCPHDGTALKPIGSEDHEQLEVIPAKIKVICHKRLKYACPCCDKHIVTASKPKQPIEKSIASSSLLAFVATQKYADALPLYRQSTMFQRFGIELDRTNLANWMVKCGQLVQPLINLLLEHQHRQPVIHMDETTVQVLDEPGKTAQSKSYMWVISNTGDQPCHVFHYADTRSSSVPLKLLSTDVQAIMTDGYQGYQKACDEYQITRLGCMAHARRKFKEAQALQKKGKTGKADQGLAFIQKLYAIEKRIKDQPPDERYKIRQTEAVPIIKKMRLWLDKSLLTVLPQSLLGKALIYLDNQWSRLIAYLEDGLYPIDNNAAERAIRPFTIGRKNWVFSKSQPGAKASANLYSLIETAKANDLNVFDYLQRVFKELPNAQSVEDVERMLPWRVELG